MSKKETMMKKKKERLQLGFSTYQNTTTKFDLKNILNLNL